MTANAGHFPPDLAAGSPRTLVDVLGQRATVHPDGIAYTFLADGAKDARSLTWSQLDRRVRALAARLCERGASGRPVLLALPSGLAFVEALFACWYAGSIAVPVSLPRHHRAKHRLDAVVADAGARFAVSASETARQLLANEASGAALSGLNWIHADETSDGSDGFDAPHAADDRVALLQYTSGSTGTPRGVVIGHANLMSNSATIAEACGHGPTQTIAGWLPLYHDMGLIGLVIQGAYSGARCVFMPPERFLMRPWLWLQMITDYGARSSPAPNFAYDLCVDRVGPEQKATLDLGGWRNALNGSEPVRAATLDRFAAAFSSCGFKREAFFPCYGLAESTLFVTGPGEARRAARRSADGTPLADGATGGHVGCGRTFGDTELAIVDPQTATKVSPGAIGEIWVAGPSVAGGYWNAPDATAASFNARIQPTAEGQAARDTWLRTGDLGFVADGELFITGRLREMIIVAGRNHFPVDVERAVEAADEAIAPSGAVAFAVDVEGAERLVVAAEVRRALIRPASKDASQPLDADAICRRIRSAVALECEVTPHDVVLLRPGAVPRTSSGKVSRLTARAAYLDGTIERLDANSYVHAGR